MRVIEINSLTKDYGNGKGVFHINLCVNRGEAMGFLGPNGAGKTTTIRQLMGFVKPDSGTAQVFGKDCFHCAAEVQNQLGYLPGEIAFMDDMNGTAFIRFIAEMKGISNLTRANQLMEYFELDPVGKIKKMSKGMKQKIGIICAFMQQPDIYILDEPTSGLDPLMQEKFVQLVLKEKGRGATFFMSSHSFEEIQRTCDRAAIIRKGKLAAVEDVEKLQKDREKIFQLYFAGPEQAKEFAAVFPGSISTGNKVQVTGEINKILKIASGFDIKDIDIRTQSLEELFMQFYGGKGND